MANTVSIDLTANIEEAVKSIEGFRKSAEKNLDQVGSFFSGLKVLAVGAIGFLASREIVHFLEDAAHAASESEKALTGLNVALKLSGDFTGKASDGFIALSKEIEKNTQFTDEAVLQSVALAKQFNTTNEQADKLVRASADLAAVTGQSLTEATRQLGQTLDGTAGRLKEQIPALRNLTEQQLKSGAAIDIVAQRFSGAAQSIGNTFAGNVIKAKNAFDNVLESIGQFITQNPIIIKGIEIAAGIFRELAETIDRNKLAIASFINSGLTKLANLIPDIIKGFQILLNVIKPVVLLVELIALSGRALVQAFVELPFIADAFAGLAKAIALATTTVFELIKNFSKLPGISDILDTIGVSTDKIGESIDSVNNKIFEFTDNISSDKIKQAAQDNTDFFSKLIDSTKAGFDSVDGTLTHLTKTTAGYASQVTEAGRAQVLASADASRALQNQAKVVQELTKAQREQAISAIQKNPVGTALGTVELPKEIRTVDIALGSITGLVGDISKGADGARKAVTTALGAIGDSILPGIGAAIAQISEFLAQGPEKIKQQVDAFIQEIPKVFVAISEGIPVFINELLAQLPVFVNGLVQAVPLIITAFLNGVPQIIQTIIDGTPLVVQGLIDGMPLVAQALINEVPDFIQSLVSQTPVLIASLSASMPLVSTALAAQAPLIATSITIELIKQAPSIAVATIEAFVHEAPKFIEAMINEVKGALGSLGNLGGTLGGFFKGLGFAEGGQVPAGFPNDSFPARLTSGEAVIDRSDNERLSRFLDAQERGQTSSNQPVVINLQIGEAQLAKVLLNLNRQGFRTAP